MKKCILILFAILFSTSLLAHSYQIFVGKNIQCLRHAKLKRLWNMDLIKEQF